MDIIAQEFRTSGNIGALARAMKNFGFKNLVLLNPQCNHLDDEAIRRSSHAPEILKEAKVVDKLNYDTLIGTTAIIGSDYNLRRNTITPEELSKMNLKGNVGLIIGREGDGLKNDELEQCDLLVTIPTSTKYPTLNVSHAATIILYELSKNSNQEKLGDDTEYALREDKDALMNLLKEKIKELPFQDKFKEQTQIIVWKKIIGKTNLTKREAMVLFGFLKKLK
jgi:tRNA/rRNA methyltransferase